MSRATHQHPQGVERGRLSNLAGWLSTACAVHCLLMPVLAGAAPVAFEAGAAELDAWLLPSVAILAIISAGFGYVRHRRWSLVTWTALGILAFLVGHWLEHERALSLGGVVGAVLLSICMFVTSRQHGAHDHESCAH